MSGSNTAWAARKLASNDITLRANVRAEHTIQVTIDRPSAYFGFVLAEYLLAHGININGKLIIKRLCDPIGRNPEDLDVLLVHRTKLADALARCNQRSLGMAAECLFKTVGAYHDPPSGALLSQGSWQTGRNAVLAFLARAHASTPQTVIDDGSGLSRENRLSAKTLTAVLTYMLNQPGYNVFVKSLATPGNGTLRKRFTTTQYRDRVHAKTGWISGAWSLSGYCRTSPGNLLAFSIIANRRSGASLRPVIDDILKEVMK